MASIAEGKNTVSTPKTIKIKANRQASVIPAVLAINFPKYKPRLRTPPRGAARKIPFPAGRNDAVRAESSPEPERSLILFDLFYHTQVKKSTA